MVRYCYDTQWIKVIVLHIYDEGHVLFSTLAVVSGITQPSHDAKNYVFIRGRGFNEPCSICALLFHCALSTPPSLDVGVL